MRSDLAQRLAEFDAEEVERESLAGLGNWVGTTYSIFFFERPDGLVERMWNSVLAHTVCYLELQVAVWSESNSESKLGLTPELALVHRALLNTVVDLLLRIAAMRKRPCVEAERELLAAYLLCSAALNERSPLGLFQNVEELFTRTELFERLAKNTQLNELVAEVRREFLLDESM